MKDLRDLTIYLSGVELTARYRYREGDRGDRQTAPTYDSVELIYVFAGERNIIDLLSGEQQDEIEEIIYRHHH